MGAKQNNTFLEFLYFGIIDIGLWTYHIFLTFSIFL